MTRVVCPSCKTAFEAKISRNDYAINCIHCGVAFNAAAFLPREAFLGIPGEQQTASPVFHPYANAAQTPAMPPHMNPPTQPSVPETRTGSLPFMLEDPSDHLSRKTPPPLPPLYGRSGMHARPQFVPEQFRKPESTKVHYIGSWPSSPPSTGALPLLHPTPGVPMPNAFSPETQATAGGVRNATTGMPSDTSEADRGSPISGNAETGTLEPRRKKSFLEASTTTSRFPTLRALERESGVFDKPTLKLVEKRSPEDREPTVVPVPEGCGFTDPELRLLENSSQTRPKHPILDPLTPPNGSAILLENASRSRSVEALLPIEPTAPAPPAAPVSATVKPQLEPSPLQVPEHLPAPLLEFSKPRQDSALPDEKADEERPRRNGRRPLLEGIFGSYEIIGEIARGGVGAVFRARELQTGRLVALKVLLEGDDASEIECERFTRECETAKALGLPGMVQIFNVGEIEGKPYMAMELVEGSSLDRLIARGGLEVHEVLEMMYRVAVTVGAMHEAGYVHRDLKPGNILLDKYGSPKVADFGLVKSLDEVTRLTASGLVCGTPAYMAPEQARGEGRNVDPRSDVWALGAVLYEALTGEPPFHAENALRLMVKITKENPELPSRRNPKVPKDIERIVMKCLEKATDKRYAHAGELGADIKRFLDGSPIQARNNISGSMLALISKERRRLFIAIAGAVAAVVLISVLVGMAFTPGDSSKVRLAGEELLNRTVVTKDDLLNAVEHFKQAINIDPQDGQAYLGIGLALGKLSIDPQNRNVIDQELFKQALRATREARAADAHLEVAACVQAARIYMWVKQYEEEVRELEHAVRLTRDTPVAEYLNALGLAYWNAGHARGGAREYYEKARQAFVSTLQVKPEYPNTREYLQTLVETVLAVRTSSTEPVR